ncbi:hypothetical protein [Sulfurimonas sp.]
MKEAKLIIEEYGLNTDEETFEIVLEVLEKFGSARNVIIEGLKPEYKYLKKLSKLVAMLSDKKLYETTEEEMITQEAEELSILMHNIYQIVSRDSKDKNEDFSKLMSSINIRKTFNPTNKQLWIMNYLGGREFISKISFQESNKLIRMIISAIEKYKSETDESSTLAIKSNTMGLLKIKSN